MVGDPDLVFEEYLLLREQLAQGRRPQSMRLRVSACCLQPIEDMRGWEICALCRRQTQIIELETIYKTPRSYDRWRKVKVSSGRPGARDIQEEWTLRLLDRWLKLRTLVEGRPREVALREWWSMLACWAALVSTTLGRDAVAAQFGLTPGQLRYRVERARDIIRGRIVRSGQRLDRSR